MREKEIRLRFGSHLFLGLTLPAGIIGASFGLASILLPDILSIEAEGDFATPVELGPMALQGPNDGEPINSRVLPLGR